MANHLSMGGGGDPELRVEAVDELVVRTVVLLCKGCPPGSLGPAAREALAEMRPRMSEALGALEDIEGLRPLTEEESARRQALAMLL
jgi:hypothetical protein